MIGLASLSCVNRGNHALVQDVVDSSFGSGGGDGMAGLGGSGGGAVGAGGTDGSSSGTGGSGGSTATGGAAGNTTSTGGTSGIGGTGIGGATATGGTPGTGGAANTGGTDGGDGSAGSGDASDAGGYVCPLGGRLDCSTLGALNLPDGQVTDFSAAQWNSTTGQLCNVHGLLGRLFSYTGPNASSSSIVAVDSTAQKLRFAATSRDWAGGGLIFESCVNVSSFSSVQFTASLVSGSLTGCTWQVQLQTQDQRASTDITPTGGTCASNCYRYPTVGNLGAPSATGTTYTEAFTQFNNPSGSIIATPTQVVGVQWQVTSTSTNGCTADLRIDNIKFM